MRDFMLLRNEFGEREFALNDEGILINIKKFLNFEAQLASILQEPVDAGAISQENFTNLAHFPPVRTHNILGMFIVILGQYSNMFIDHCSKCLAFLCIILDIGPTKILRGRYQPLGYFQVCIDINLGRGCYRRS